MKTTALRAVPVFGWLYLLLGLAAALLGRAPASRTLRLVWWADAVLSTVGHAAQIPIALAADELASRSRLRTAVMTQIFGLTWWRTGARHPRAKRLRMREVAARSSSLRIPGGLGGGAPEWSA